RAESGIDVEQIGGVEAAAAPGVADQVMARGGETAAEVRRFRETAVAGEDGVPHVQDSRFYAVRIYAVRNASAKHGHVVRDWCVGDLHTCVDVVQEAAAFACLGTVA